MALTAVVGVQVATSQSASAAACISTDNVHSWYVNGSASAGNSKSPTYTTTANCQDINFALGEVAESGDAVGRVRVCFVGAGYCQSSWKSYNSRTQNRIVVATNVSDGTTFKMEFDWGTGTVADRFGFGIWA
ncbi:hypothetical protein FHR83_004024 [Actinoplanes campanulatus]|uniref:Secreted protein n=1 Tax=Actinoplanes campanulatus TaxID=113559 RepID=A0A7W5FFC4_9ACTN|nr:hypothetical protein [Actinoplanes campanulatus]MBB3096354.1 hypothetical protein [Actinoplanes campanulatus]GGN18838.1 hypothetical protein GCM10010109_32150 [Actinoplanes campanulatus]GID38421.1 hypothetical protein Aca09nite_49270 [Actinoplanes campanulatus]